MGPIREAHAGAEQVVVVPEIGDMVGVCLRKAPLTHPPEDCALSGDVSSLVQVDFDNHH